MMPVRVRLESVSRAMPKSVSFSLSGMQTATRKAQVQLAQNVVADVKLGVAGVEESITVTAEASLIDTESGRTREIDTNNRGLRERYAAAASEQRSDIRLAIAGSGAHHLQLRTDRDWLLDLARHVASTKRRQANVGGAHR